jgi:hypothetical protein
VNTVPGNEYLTRHNVKNSFMIKLFIFWGVLLDNNKWQMLVAVVNVALTHASILQLMYENFEQKMEIFIWNRFFSHVWTSLWRCLFYQKFFFFFILIVYIFLASYVNIATKFKDGYLQIFLRSSYNQYYNRNTMAANR